MTEKKRNPRITPREWDLANEVIEQLRGRSRIPVTEEGLRRGALLARYRVEVEEGQKP